MIFEVDLPKRFAEGFGSFAPFLAYLIFVWVLLISILRILIKKSFDRRFLLVEVTMECIANIKCCTFPLISILNFVLMFFFLINKGSLSSKFLVIFIFSDQWIFLPSMLQVHEQLSIFPLRGVSYIDQIKRYHSFIVNHATNIDRNLEVPWSSILGTQFSRSISITTASLLSSSADQPSNIMCWSVFFMLALIASWL